ncbi:N-acetylated-alpha-linked acidic dipeptidase 2 [Nymphon striatum]|nr:N-acetylated-alpha-linked acidic dipeptidase 2 [Nymphon striatum]
MPGDYVKGKTSYTKWDVDSENVDIDMEKEDNAEANRCHEEIRVINNSSRGWFSGKKGQILKFLLCAAIFMMGLFIGYLLRKSVHEYVIAKPSVDGCIFQTVTDHQLDNENNLKSFITSEHIMKDIERSKSWSEKIFIGNQASLYRAEELRQEILRFGLDAVELDEHSVLMSLPPKKLHNEVILIDSSNNQVYEASSPAVPVGTNEEAFQKLWPYTLYSANGTVQASYIYAHYGRREDYEVLETLGVQISGKILILRLGKTHVANKVELAEIHGAVGILLYPDPADYKEKDSQQYLKKSISLPSDSIVITNAKLIPGDPETPNTPSTSDSYRLPRKDLPLPKIPIQPISPMDALNILKYLGGPTAPNDSWKGELKNVNYNIGPEQGKGPSPLKIHMTIRNILERRKIVNVIAAIRGKVEPGRYIIIGNQLGCWSSKGIDSGPTDAVFLEVIRGFALLLKTGWRPNRSIIFAGFDGQEFGNVGMEEWLQVRKLAAFYGSYSLAVQASPLLRKAIVESSKDVRSHESTETDILNVYDTWKKRRPQVTNDSDSDVKIDPPGTANDFLDPIWMSGIPSAQFHFVGKTSDKYLFYHTKSYTFGVVQSVSEPAMLESLAEIISLSALKLIDSLQLPMTAEDYPKQIQIDLSIFMENYGDILQAHNISSNSLQLPMTAEDYPKQTQIDLVYTRGHNFKIYKAFSRLNIRKNSFTQRTVDRWNNLSSDVVIYFLQLREYNDRMLQFEKSFLVDPLFGDIVHHDNVEVQLVSADFSPSCPFSFTVLTPRYGPLAKDHALLGRRSSQSVCMVVIVIPSLANKRDRRRNLLYGPNPDNVGEVSAFPRLQAAINRAKYDNTIDNWNIVKEELSLVSKDNLVANLEFFFAEMIPKNMLDEILKDEICSSHLLTNIVASRRKRKNELKSQNAKEKKKKEINIKLVRFDFRLDFWQASAIVLYLNAGKFY